MDILMMACGCLSKGMTVENLLFNIILSIYYPDSLSIENLRQQKILYGKQNYVMHTGPLLKPGIEISCGKWNALDLIEK